MNINKNELVFGTQLLGSKLNIKDSLNILNHSYVNGITHFDTAERYPFPECSKNFGLTEKIIGQWLTKNKGIRKKIIISSKVTGRNFGEIKNISSKRLSPKRIMYSVDKILKRLNTSYIDNYFLHWPDRFTNNFGRKYYKPESDPIYIKIEDQYSALLKLKQQGKILNFGISNETPWGIMKFSSIAKQFFKPILQEEYSILNRNIEKSLKEISVRESLKIYSYSPLSGGLLTGKYFDKIREFKKFRGVIYKTKSKKLFTKKRFKFAKILHAFCLKKKINMTHLSISFLKRSDFLTGVIIGASNIDQFNEFLSFWRKPLSKKIIKEALEKIENANNIY